MPTGTIGVSGVNEDILSAFRLNGKRDKIFFRQIFYYTT